jgi:acyl carrier protein
MSNRIDRSAGTGLSREQILTEVKKIVAEFSEMAPEAIREDADLEIDLGVDSLSQIEIVMELEERFDISISDEVADEIRTVGQVVDRVERLLAEPKSVSNGSSGNEP